MTALARALATEPRMFRIDFFGASGQVGLRSSRISCPLPVFFLVVFGHRPISFAVILKLHDVYNFVNRLDKIFRPCYVLCIARVRLDDLRAAQVG